MGFRQWCAAVDFFSRATIQVHVGLVVFVVVFVVFVRSAMVFPFFLVVFVGTNKRWINVSGVLRAMVFYVFVVAFWQVGVLSFFLFISLSCHGVSFCLSCFLGGRHCFWSFIRASGHCVLWFCFVVAR